MKHGGQGNFGYFIFEFQACLPKKGGYRPKSLELARDFEERMTKSRELEEAESLLI